MKAYWAQWNSIVVEDGLLHHVWESKDGRSSTLQLILPKIPVDTVLRELYNSSAGGHLRIYKTTEFGRDLLDRFHPRRARMVQNV